MAAPARAVSLLANGVRERKGASSGVAARQAREPLPAGGGSEHLTAHVVLQELGARVRPDAVIVEEAPSSRGDLLDALPARRPMGFLSAAMGGLGFAIPAATGLRLADEGRPVVAVVGDGSALYAVQALWSAARYGAGVLVVVLSNGRYAIMDELARAHPGRVPWPAFEEFDIGGIARSLGCPARRIDTREQLSAVLDEVVPGLADRREPLLLDVRVRPPHQLRQRWWAASTRRSISASKRASTARRAGSGSYQDDLSRPLGERDHRPEVRDEGADLLPAGTRGGSADPDQLLVHETKESGPRELGASDPLSRR